MENYNSYSSSGGNSSFFNRSFSSSSPLNRSSLGVSMTGGPAYSKSVVDALKALQEKIRRLEMERDAYLKAVRTMEAETETYKEMSQSQRDQLEEQRRLLERMKKNEDALQRELEDSARLRDYTARKDRHHNATVADLQNHVQQLEQQLQESQQQAHAAELERQLVIARLKDLEEKTLKQFRDNSNQQRGRSRSVGAQTRDRSVNMKVSGTQTKKETLKKIPEMPFVVGKPSRKSFHIASNVQKAVTLINQYGQQQDDAKARTRSPAKPLAAPCSKVDTSFCATSGIPHEVTVQDIDEHFNPDRTNNNNASNRNSNNTNNNANNNKQVEQDIENLIRSLEGELSQLNQQMSVLGSQAVYDRDNVYLNSTLTTTSEKINQKQEQIMTLRRYHNELKQRNRANSTTTPKSPKSPKSPVVDHKRLKAVTLLRNLQEL